MTSSCPYRYANLPGLWDGLPGLLAAARAQGSGETTTSLNAQYDASGTNWARLYVDGTLTWTVPTAKWLHMHFEARQ